MKELDKKTAGSREKNINKKAGDTQEKKNVETRKEYESNMHRTYAYKNRGLEIKIDTMEILYNKLKMLAEDSQELQDENTYRSLEVMAKLGQAILQD